jgi:hypothetical protein
LIEEALFRLGQIEQRLAEREEPAAPPSGESDEAREESLSSWPKRNA